MPPSSDGLPGLVGVHQDGGVDVQNDLVPLSRGAGIDALVERGLGEQRQCVGLLLLHRRRVGVGLRLMTPLIQVLTRRLQRLQGARRPPPRRQPPSDPDRAVFVLIHVQRTSRVMTSGFLSLEPAVHPAPATHDPLSRARQCRRGPPLTVSLPSGALQHESAHGAWHRTARRGRVLATATARCRARATRTCSRAAPGAYPTRQDSHAAQDRKPLFQPSRASNSRIRSSSRAVAASR